MSAKIPMTDGTYREIPHVIVQVRAPGRDAAYRALLLVGKICLAIAIGAAIVIVLF